MGIPVLVEEICDSFAEYHIGIAFKLGSPRVFRSCYQNDQ